MGWSISFVVGLPSCLEGVLSSLPNKTLSCNQDVTLVQHFKSLLQRDRTEEITHSPNIAGAVTQIYLTWPKLPQLGPLKLPQLGPREAEAKHSRGPTQWKLSRWRLNATETQCMEVTRSPACWKLAQQKQTRQKASTAQSQNPENFHLR